MRKSTAFTLIELLVVIAIIAILAAILFPVFAQAKAAAKKTVAISNYKQVAIAYSMYANDSDDSTVPAFKLKGRDDTCNLSQWNQRIYSYLKENKILLDPANSRTPTPADLNWSNKYYVARPDSAPNWHLTMVQGIPPDACGNTFSQEGVKLGAVERPAQVIFLGPTGMADWTGNLGLNIGAASTMNPWHGSEFGGGTAHKASIRCSQRYDAYDTINFAQAAWSIHWRHADGGIFAFTDGHAAFKKRGSIKAEEFYPGSLPTYATDPAQNPACPTS